MEVQIKEAAQQAAPQKEHWHPLTWFLVILVVGVLVAGVAVTVARDLGLYTPSWARPQVTVGPAAATSAPVATRAPAVQQEQAQPTVAPATPLPQGQPIAPVIQADPAAPQPAPVVTGPNPDAPAQIRTRGAVCFGGWWYLDGEKQDKSCSGTGGD